eukprot:gnl/TRDRNA2_/TRDRNA2_177467_c0_seq1.p1 gnl/TRDRNA2_/TRDRNA2_177467_c0~~gnl/TRDRNA2_/TRDRNA2_177467_c0_seq1.p1  ORF type:complete len:610 (-),score=-30.09 gnl/TRDRNA2_/TRDRNA2_177467_c0_seq1:116-1945(-)
MSSHFTEVREINHDYELSRPPIDHELLHISHKNSLSHRMIKEPDLKSNTNTQKYDAYVPPFKMARILPPVLDKTSLDYQRSTWAVLKKSLNGLVNKVNNSNLENIVTDMLRENLVRGRGLLTQSLIKAQTSSPDFTKVFAALVSVINTKLPEIGILLVKRVIIQFRKAYLRSDKRTSLSTTLFIAHLVNQGVVHNLLALEILMLLLERPSAHSVELAVAFTKEVGAGLQDSEPQGLQAAFEKFRDILQEGKIDTKTQYSIESLIRIRQKGFDESGYSVRTESLDLVESRNLITHEIYLDDQIEHECMLDDFKYDHNYEKHEDEYEEFRREILYNHATEKGLSMEETEEIHPLQYNSIIRDKTETKLLNLRRTIYLTIMSSLDFEESGHKLSKIKLDPGQETELVTMIIESCSQERMYTKYFGLLAQRFCQLYRSYQELFEQCFEKQYMLIHRLEINKLRNVAKLFAHLIGSDAISWDVLLCIRLTVEDTTSSARIFIKIIFQELSENLGLTKLQERICKPDQAHCFANIFPRNTTSNIRFSINFFTSIGLGSLTNHQREYLKRLPEFLNIHGDSNIRIGSVRKGDISTSSPSYSSNSSTDDSDCSYSES